MRRVKLLTDALRHTGYSATRKNLKINKNTRVICQGFTGKHATIQASLALRYGTNIVGGVTPGKGGQSHIGLPVFNTVQEAKTELKPNASIIYVPPTSVKSAIHEALDSEIELIVCVTEGVPVHDTIEIKARLESQNKSRLVGPNSYGLISPGVCKIGIMPDHIYRQGNVGIVSRSGSLTYDSVLQTTKYGLGQSYSIGIGGDPYLGTDFVDVLDLFMEDRNTHGIILIGEIGGITEERAAEYLMDHNSGKNKKPVVCFIAGITAPTGKRLGHAGAIIQQNTGSAIGKINALLKAGCIVVQSPGHIGAAIKRELTNLQELN